MWNFEMLEEANRYLEEECKPIPIERFDKQKGKKITKNYLMVKDKVSAFRHVCPCGIIESELIKLDSEEAVFKTSIYDDDENLLAVGHAWESRDSSTLNKAAYVENAETSSIGRALSNLGIGITDSFAGYEEVMSADDTELEMKSRATSRTIKDIKFQLEQADIDLKMIEDWLEHDIEKCTNGDIEEIKKFLQKRK